MKPLTAGASLWMESAKMPHPAPLDRNTTADVCIVGAGIAGLSAAYMLTDAGLRVVVIDDGPLAGGETQMTTAHLSNEIDDRYVEIERLHGASGALLAAESHTAAIDRIEAIVEQEKIDCDFARVDGYLFGNDEAAHGDADLLRQEFEAAKRTGIVEVDWASHAPLGELDTGPCLCFRRQGQFHPLKYLAGVAAAIQARGGRIYSETHARSIRGGGSARVEIESDLAITCQSIVVATNTPVNDLFAIHTKQAPYLSYVIGVRVPKGSVERALFWDTCDPYHYVRLQSAPDDPLHEIMIVGGEDHKTGQTDDGQARYDRLETWIRRRVHEAGDVAFQWSGQVMETIDGLAFIGRNPLDEKNVYIATGDSGMGMTHGTIAGMLISDLILQKENPWAALYDPSRKTPSAWRDFARENLNVAAQYTSWITPGDVSSIDEIPPGQGAIVREGLKKCAVYRDDQGQVTKLSAVCPHLQCIVAWNGDAKTWDCPCHGSRFAADGTVLDGPANQNLEPG